MTWAIIKTGGKQYKIKDGDKIKVEKLAGEVGQEIEIKDVLLTAEADGQSIKIGAPLVTGAKVQTKVLEQGRGKKIRVIKYKSKVRYRKEFGHRQPFTELEILKISWDKLLKKLIGGTLGPALKFGFIKRGGTILCRLLFFWS